MIGSPAGRSSGDDGRAIGGASVRMAASRFLRSASSSAGSPSRLSSAARNSTSSINDGIAAADGAIAAVAAGFVPDSRRQSRALPAHCYTRRADRLRAQIDHTPQKMWITLLQFRRAGPLSDLTTIGCAAGVYEEGDAAVGTAIVTIRVRRRVDTVHGASAAPWARLRMQRVLRERSRSGRRLHAVLPRVGAAAKPHTTRRS